MQNISERIKQVLLQECGKAAEESDIFEYSGADHISRTSK